MTEQELRSKSDQEINLLAAEAMGWPIQNHPQPETPLPKIINERGQLTLLSKGPGGHPVISFWLNPTLSAWGISDFTVKPFAVSFTPRPTISTDALLTYEKNNEI